MQVIVYSPGENQIILMPCQIATYLLIPWNFPGARLGTGLQKPKQQRLSF
jgi:hypothetical protein